MHLRYFIVICILLPLAGCNKNTGTVPEDPSFATDVFPLFSGRCAGCHNSGTPNGGYDVTTYAGVMGAGSDSVPNVMPGNPDSSKLYRRLKGIETPQMPLGGTPLDSTELQTVRNWIARGAKNN